MINHFPTPYPDELLHSTIARYHLRSANYFIRHTMYDVFERDWVSATVYLPSLVSEISKQTNLDTDALIRKHTMYPFQTSFIKTDQARKIYQSMVNDDGRKAVGGCGLMRSKMPINKYIKFCPLCFTEDYEEYGEFYWHCIHQLPGRTICKKHKVWLQDSDVLVQHKNRTEYILPTDNNCDTTKIEEVTEEDYEFHNKLISFVEQLFANTYSLEKYSYFSDFYRNALKEKGLLFKNDYINWDALYQVFYEKYSEKYLMELHLQLNSNPTWVEMFLRKQRVSFHPYTHFLMLDMLEKNLDEIFPSRVENGLVVTLKSEHNDLHGNKSFCIHCFKYLLDERLSFKEIEELMHVDSAKLEWLSGNIGSKNFKVAKKHSKLCKEVDRYRWLKLQEVYPAESKSALRQMEQSLYTRIKRHDKEWLDANSPLLRQ